MRYCQEYLNQHHRGTPLATIIRQELILPKIVMTILQKIIILI